MSKEFQSHVRAEVHILAIDDGVILSTRNPFKFMMTRKAISSISSSVHPFSSGRKATYARPELILRRTQSKTSGFAFDQQKQDWDGAQIPLQFIMAREEVSSIFRSNLGRPLFHGAQGSLSQIRINF